MKRLSELLALLVFIFLIPETLPAADLTASQIMQKVYEKNIEHNTSADMEMLLIDRFGAERLRRVQVFSNTFDDSTRRMMFFSYPGNVRGTAFLIHDFNDPAMADEQWLYLPSLHKTKRIGSSEKNTSFMGSDFSFADLSRKNIADYTYSIMKEDKVGEEKVWLIDSKPVNPAVLERDGYSRSILFVRQDNFFIIRAVNWDQASGNLKYMDVRRLEKIDGNWLPLEIHMTTKRDGKTIHKTVLTYSNINTGAALKKDFFSLRQMEKGI